MFCIVFLYAAGATGLRQLKKLQAAAPGLRVTLLSVGIKKPDDFDRAFARITKERSGALVVHGTRLLSNTRRQIFEFTLKSRLPAV